MSEVQNEYEREIAANEREMIMEAETEALIRRATLDELAEAMSKANGRLQDEFWDQWKDTGAVIHKCVLRDMLEEWAKHKAAERVNGRNLV